MAAKKKYYVVWYGITPGIYNTWEEAKRQVSSYPGARYKGFESYFDACEAFKNPPPIFSATQKQRKENPNKPKNGIAVDAACCKNPGAMEYRGVLIDTNEELFRKGPFPDGTNNVGEFLAIVHALALCKQKQWNYTIYSDSNTALSWVRNKKAKTKLFKTDKNDQIFDLIERAEFWLQTNTFNNPLLKWDSEAWGEIPADFGRK